LVTTQKEGRERSTIEGLEGLIQDLRGPKGSSLIDDDDGYDCDYAVDI
jgi:hypothetical protein